MKLIRWLKQLICSHDNMSLRVEIIGYGYRLGDRVYHKCGKCGKLTVTEEGIEI